MLEATQNYIAKELTHFTEKYDTFCDIINDRILLGGPNIEVSRKGGIEVIINYKENINQDKMIEVNKVCFCDIPEGETAIHKKKYGEFGISFEKFFIIGKGGIPVHYVPNDAIIPELLDKGHKTKANLFNDLTKELYWFLAAR